MISKFGFRLTLNVEKYIIGYAILNTCLMIMQAQFQSGDKLECLVWNIATDLPECHSFDLCTKKRCKAYKVISVLFSISHVSESSVFLLALDLFFFHLSSVSFSKITILNSWTPSIWRSRQPGPQFDVEYMQKHEKKPRHIIPLHKMRYSAACSIAATLFALIFGFWSASLRWVRVRRECLPILQHIVRITGSLIQALLCRVCWTCTLY